MELEEEGNGGAQLGIPFRTLSVSLVLTFTVLLLLPINNHAQHNDHLISSETLLAPKVPESISQSTRLLQSNLPQKKNLKTKNKKLKHTKLSTRKPQFNKLLKGKLRKQESRQNSPKTWCYNIGTKICVGKTERKKKLQDSITFTRLKQRQNFGTQNQTSAASKYFGNGNKRPTF